MTDLELKKNVETELNWEPSVNAATAAHSEGVLPAYFLGLACAGVLLSQPEISRRRVSVPGVPV